MSASRSVMVVSGGGLVTLAMVGVTARLFQLGPLAASVADLPGAAFFASVGALAVVGVVMIVFAPPSRHGERRVRLDNDAQADAVLRPQARQDGPVTRGIAHAAAPAAAVDDEPDAESGPGAASMPPEDGDDATAPAPKPPAVPRPAADGPKDPSSPRLPPPGPPRRDTRHDPDGAPAWGSTQPPPPGPGVSGGFVQQASARWAGSRARSERSGAPSAGAPDDDGATSGRSALLARLDELDRKANSIKVQFGLGKLSAAAYSHYLREIEAERMKVERSLIEEDILD